MLDLESEHLKRGAKVGSQKVESDCKYLIKIRKNSILEKYIYDLNEKDLAN